MICKKCHNNVKTDFKYCPYCGERVISDFQESYGEFTPPFIIEDQVREGDEAAKFYAPDPVEKQPDLDRYSSAPPSATGDGKRVGDSAKPTRDYDAAPVGYDRRPASYKPAENASSAYFVYPEELMYGSRETQREEYTYDAPVATAPRYDAPAGAEPKYDAPRVAEKKYDAPPVRDPRYTDSRADEPYYVYPGSPRPDGNRQEVRGEPVARGGVDNRNQNPNNSGVGFEEPDQYIQIDMSFAEPGTSEIGQTGRDGTDTDVDGSPYYVYGNDADAERESVLPFDSSLSDDFAAVHVRQSGSQIAAKLALILLIAAVAVAISIFGYRYISGLSNKFTLPVGTTSNMSKPSSSGSESSSSVPSSSASSSVPSTSGTESSSSAPSSSAPSSSAPSSSVSPDASKLVV